MILVLIVAAFIYLILTSFASIRNHKKGKKASEDSQSDEKKSWLARNIWIVAVAIAIFLIHLCSDIAKMPQ